MYHTEHSMTSGEVYYVSLQYSASAEKGVQLNPLTDHSCNLLLPSCKKFVHNRWTLPEDHMHMCNRNRSCFLSNALCLAHCKEISLHKIVLPTPGAPDRVWFFKCSKQIFYISHNFVMEFTRPETIHIPLHTNCLCYSDNFIFSTSSFLVNHSERSSIVL